MIHITLPTPPSLNQQTFNLPAKAAGGRGGRAKTPAYKAWIIEASWLASPALKAPKIRGWYEIEMRVHPKTRADVDNLPKAVLDLLGPSTKHGLGVTPDDRLAWRVSIERDPEVCRGLVSIRIAPVQPESDNDIDT